MFESKLSKRSVTPGTSYKRTRFVQIEKENLSDHESYVVDDDEETREISEHLSLIRKKHDKIKEENLKKKKLFEKLKKDLETAQEVSQNEDNEGKFLQSSYDSLQSQLVETRRQQLLETKDSNTYLYMLDRMKRDKIAMEIKANSIQVNLKSSKQLLNAETKNFRKLRETHFQSRLILRELQKSFISQRKIKDDKLQQLQRDIKSRQDAALRREYRQKKQAEIAEAAARDDKDSHEVKLRECLLVNKMWQHYLNKKLEKEKASAIEIEKAFNKIKLATGLNDINEICEKYLTREQNYLTLISAVNEAERKLEILKVSNEKARETLQSMQLEDIDHRIIYNELDKYDTKVLSSLKEYSGVKEKLQNSTKIHDQILNWCEKIFKLLKIDKETDEKLAENQVFTSNLLEMFGLIYEKLNEMIVPLYTRKEESLKVLEKYAQKKTSEIILDISKDHSFPKMNKLKTETEIAEEEDFVDESHKQVVESKEESRRKSKKK